MTRICFVDTETTGLRPEVHSLWEIGLIVRDDQNDKDNDREFLWQIYPRIDLADPNALRVSKFYDRFECFSTEGYVEAKCMEGPNPGPTANALVALQVASLLDGAIVVGAIPWFDAGTNGFLELWLRGQRQNLTCHYHLVDVEALAYGVLWERFRQVSSEGKFPERCAMPSRLPLDSNELTELLLGSRWPEKERHTALGDARWARAIFDACTDPGAGYRKPDLQVVPPVEHHLNYHRDDPRGEHGA